MRKLPAIFLSVLFLGLVAGGIFLILEKKKETERPREVGCTMEAKICSDGTAVGRSGPKCEFAPCPDVPGLVTDERVRVAAPLANSLVKSPLTVTGEARGTWYFEAGFPVRLLDANGKELGVVSAQAKSNWMTTEFVPFEAVLSFVMPTPATGTLVLEKDNPSGLPENAAEARIPVRFR